jgi:hypothetical protein
MTTYFVNASRLSVALVNGAERQRELIGPFDDWLAASRYAVAWRNLWEAEKAEAHVETPLTPCVDVLEWYDAKLDDVARRQRNTADAYAHKPVARGDAVDVLNAIERLKGW